MRHAIRRGAVVFSYAPLLGLAAAISFGKLIVYAALIDVEQFGALGKMLLVSTLFGMGASLGMQSVASRDLPALLARRRARRGLRLLGQTIAVAAWTALLGLCAAAAGMRLFDLTAVELTLAVLHGFAQLAFLTLAFESRSRLEMTRYSRDLAARSAVIACAGTAVAAVGGGASAIVVAEAVGTVPFCIFIARIGLRHAHAGAGLLLRRWALHRERLPWRAALLAGAGTLVMFASFNLDRWIAAETLPRDTFGAYAFGWLALVAAQSLQAMLNSGLLPLLARRRVEALEASAYRLTILLSTVLLTAGLIAMAPAAWVLRTLVEAWMPQYSGAGPLWAPLLLAAVFRVADFWSSLLLVVEREGALLLAQVAAIAVSAFGYLSWLAFGNGAVTPVSLAWLAAVAAALSHAVSAVAVARLRAATGLTS